MNQVAEIGSKAGLSFLAIQVLEVIVAAGCMLPPAELARKFKVDPTQIRDLTLDPHFQKAYHVVILGDCYYKLGQVIKRITEQAIKGNAAQQKIFLQLHGLIDAKNGASVNLNQFNFNQSPEEIIAKRKELEANLKNEIKKENGGQPVIDIQFEDDKPKPMIDTDTNEVINDDY